MTATDAAAGRERAAPPADLGPALGRLATAALEAGAAKLSQKTEGWARGLEEYAATRGVTERAAYEGLKADLLGRNPVWAAMKGAWWGASTPLKVAAVLALVLVLLLSPVTLVLLLLGALLAAIVAGIRAATR